MPSHFVHFLFFVLCVFAHTHTHILVARMHAQAHISWSLLYPLFVSNVIFKWLVCFPVVSSVPCLFVSVTACLIIKTCFPLFLGRIETSLDISEVHFLFFNVSYLRCSTCAPSRSHNILEFPVFLGKNHPEPHTDYLFLLPFLHVTVCRALANVTCVQSEQYAHSFASLLICLPSVWLPCTSSVFQKGLEWSWKFVSAFIKLTCS